MSERFPGGFITNNPTAPTTTSAPGIWTLDQATQYIKAGTWPYGGPFNYIEDVFSTYLYTGNATARSITNNINLSTNGGLVWIKERSAALDHNLFDTNRGAGYALYSNLTNGQSAFKANTLTSFDTTGFSLGTDAGGDGVNRNGQTYASWTFRKQPKFFDVVTFTSDGSGGGTFNHSLGSTPGCVIIKSTSAANSWLVYHRSTGVSKYLELQSTAAQATGTNWISVDSTSVTVGSGWLGASRSMVAYLFAHNAGGFGLTGTDNVISCGSYTGTGSVGPSVSLGYEPQWLLIKRATGTSATSGWYLLDNMRGIPLSGGSNYLRAETNDAETNNSYAYATPTATGFNVDPGGVGLTGVNFSGETYIYIAIRRGPMKTPTSGTSVYNAISRVGTGTAASITGVGFPPDLFISTDRYAGYTGWISWYDKLRGIAPQIHSDSTNAEITSNPITSYDMNGITVPANNYFVGTGDPYIFWFFRRAPGFFDEVCGTSTATANQRFNHNLGVAPEIIISKNRTNASSWFSYWQSLGRDYFISLNSTSAGSGGNTNIWGNTNPTTTDFGIDTSASTGFGYSSGSNLVFYLFASCPGVSKVGSYTGNGSTQTISCGFAARFVMIKQTSAGSGTDWWVWDTARGMVAGTDPRLALNSTAGETNANWVYTDASGFQIVTSDAAVNASTKSYIFLAIA